MKASIAPTFGRLYGAPITGAAVDVAVGTIDWSGGWYGTMSGLAGATQFGLLTRQLSIGGRWEYAAGWIHPGVGLQIGYISINRVEAGSLSGSFVGPRLTVEIDLVHWCRHAVFVGARAGVDAIASAAEPLWSLSTGAGVRY